LLESQARRELKRLTEHGTVVAHPPEWALPTEPAPAWMLIGDDIALPLHHNAKDGILLATSVLTRASVSEADRASRNAKAASRRAARHSARRALGERGKRPRPALEEWTT
jgi:hypothetical protein